MRKSLIASACLACALLSSITLVLLVAVTKEVLAEEVEAGTWQIVNGSQEGTAWKLNTKTGQSYYCFRFKCLLQLDGDLKDTLEVARRQQQQQQQLQPQGK
jgi:hypothetical protein